MTKSIGMLVAGEIGPAETRLALCGLDMGRPVVVVEDVLPSAGTSGLGAMVQAFLTVHRPPQIRGAAFVVPGTVRDGVSLAANLAWPVDARVLGGDLGIERVTVLNDVEAIAHALPTIGRDELTVVSDGAPTEPGNQAVLTAGACPGMAGLFWNGTEHCPFVSEGGHADFAPSSEEEAALARRLAEHVPRVTVELVLSASGLELIYRSLREGARGGDGPRSLRDAMERDGAAPVILREATGKGDRTCKQALEIFVGILGSAAANLALTLGATGGVYLAGRLIPSLRGPLCDGGFLAAFCRKAPMEDLLRRVPVLAVMNERAALLGAASVAARELRSRRVGGWAS